MDEFDVQGTIQSTSTLLISTIYLGANRPSSSIFSWSHLELIQLANPHHHDDTMPPKFQPRPTSPLNFEPLSHFPEDVLYPGSGDEETLEGHRDKRRRVEALGTQYLQGRGLVILSAGLRGPFEHGWENPWASKWPRRPINNIREIPVEPREAADIGLEKRSNGLRASVPDVGAGGDTVLRAKSASLAVYTAARTRPAEQDPVQEQRRHGNGESTNNLSIPNQGKVTTGGLTNIPDVPKIVDLELPVRGDDLQLTSPKGWLKTVLKGRFRQESESPSSTPTPAPKSQDRTPGEHSLPAKLPPTTINVPRSPEPMEQPVQKATSYSGFTPVNRHKSPQTLQSPAVGHKDVPPRLQNATKNVKANTQTFNRVIREMALAEADEVTRKGYEEVKHLSQEAIKRAKADDDAHLEAKRLSQEAAMRAYHTSTNSTPIGSQSNITEAPPPEARKALAGSPHEVPPSTSLPGFEYRLAKRPSSASSRGSSSFSDQLQAAKADVKAKRPISPTKTTSRFAKEMQAAKVKAKAQAIRRLSFTASGRLKSPRSRRSSLEGEDSPTRRQQRSSLRCMETSHEEGSSDEGAYASATSKLPSISGDTSKPEALPEGQVVAVDHAGFKVPSGPSTNLLETDKQSLKFPSIDEGDSYMNLSTQAAIAKAQRSFQNEVLSPFKSSPQKHRPASEISPTAYKTPIAAFPLSLTTTTVKRADGQGIMDEDDGDPISTQAMIDAMSPFAVTTVKKKLSLARRDSFARSAVTSPASPTTNLFRPISPSMSTSVSPSPSPIRRTSPPPLSLPISLRKGPSSLTSFSIAPNGTLTEVYQHDGQQQQFNEEDGWNLEDALQEAGSFLGTWEVEAEARKVGSVVKGGSSGASGARGILSSGKARD